MENTKYIVDWHNQRENNTWFIAEKKETLQAYDFKAFIFKSLS